MSLVSIVIPTFNRSHLIGETLESILNQTFQNWECLIVDDGSIDYTKELMEFYCEKDSRISFIPRPSECSSGANACRNHGYRVSKGEYVKWFDSDDLLMPDALEVQVEHLNKLPQLDVSIGYVRCFRTHINDSWIAKPAKLETDDAIFDYVTGKFYLSTGGPLWRKQFLKGRELLFDERLSRQQDTEFHYRMLLEGMKFEFLDRPVEYYRYGAPGAITANSSDDNLNSVFYYWHNVLRTAECRVPENNHKLKLFVANKLSLLYQRMMLNYNTTGGRLKIANKYFGTLMGIYRISKVPFQAYFKALVGSIVTILTGKGLKFFRINN